MPRELYPAQPPGSLAAQLLELMDERGLNPRELSLKAGLSGDGIRNILRGIAKAPRAVTLQKIADALGVPSANLMEGFVNASAQAAGGTAPTLTTEGWVEVPELDVRPSADGEPTETALPGSRKPLGHWRMPKDILDARGVPPDKAVIIRVFTDTGDLRAGDRLLISLQKVSARNIRTLIWSEDYGHEVAEHVGKGDGLSRGNPYRYLDGGEIQADATTVGYVVGKLL